ncbi:putative UPF0481 protein [Tanacetum coccineum]
MSNINNKQPQDLTDYDGISQSDVTTKNLSNSDEASTTTPMGILLGCAKKGGDRKKQRPPTICKVSSFLRDLSKSSFDPQLVSIHVKETTIHVDSDSTHDHVLGYLHKRFQLVVVKPSNPIHALKSKLAAAKLLNPIRALISKLVDKKGSKNTHAAFHSIVELDRSGMNFKPHQEGVWSMTIKFQSSLFACLPGFWSKATLLMPTLVIDDTAELILRNLIAYEQSFPQDRYYFTSYAMAYLFSRGYC